MPDYADLSMCSREPAGPVIKATAVLGRASDDVGRSMAISMCTCSNQFCLCDQTMRDSATHRARQYALGSMLTMTL